MGSEIVTIYVGAVKQPFSIHKKLITATGPFFVDLFNVSTTQGQPVVLAAENPGSFKLFIEFLYTKRVPKVRPAEPDRLIQVARLRELCQLYAFTDRYKLNNVVRNRVMDSIQDGFATVKLLPEAGLIKVRICVIFSIISHRL
jgi:BTB/POZ domain